MSFGSKRRRKETAIGTDTPFGRTKSLTATDGTRVRRHCRVLFNTYAYPWTICPYACRLQGAAHFISVDSISVFSAALRSQCKMAIGAELSVYASVRRNRSKRFHESRALMWSATFVGIISRAFVQF